jgi:hypothetical protein
MYIERKTLQTPTGNTIEYFYDPVKPAEYRRIVGALAWPSGDLSGFIVVIAEDYHEDYGLKLRHLRLLTEFESRDIPILAKRLYDFQNTYLVKPWYGDANNEMMMKFISMFNGTLARGKKGVYVASAPFVEDSHNLRFYANQIRRLVQPGRKTLHFGEDSQIPGRLSALTPDEVQRAGVAEYPAIAALGYAVAALDEPYFDVMEAREYQNELLNTYNVAGL